MSTIELRHLINEYLSQIDDISFLKTLKTMIEAKASEGIYKLSDEQKKRIDLGREQVRNGQTIPQDKLQKEIDQWLDSK